MSKKLLFVVGSLRKGSFNHSLAKYVEELIGNKAEVEYLNFANIPYMNQDIEFPVPSEIAAVREKVSGADGIWIFSPEYNYAIPGVLKNLLDWLSRPLVQYDFQGPSAVHEKSNYKRSRRRFCSFQCKKTVSITASFYKNEFNRRRRNRNSTYC